MSSQQKGGCCAVFCGVCYFLFCGSADEVASEMAPVDAGTGGDGGFGSHPHDDNDYDPNQPRDGEMSSSPVAHNKKVAKSYNNDAEQQKRLSLSSPDLPVLPRSSFTAGNNNNRNQV